MNVIYKQATRGKTLNLLLQGFPYIFKGFPLYFLEPTLDFRGFQRF